MSIQGVPYIKTNGPGNEVGLQLYELHISFTCDLYKTFPS